MISLAEWLTPTRFIGLGVYLFAAICCGAAWTRSRGGGRANRLPAILTVLEAGLFLDMASNLRWGLHGLLESEAIREDLYALRTGPQLAVLGFLGLTAAAAMGMVIRRLRGRYGATVAACGAILSLSLWCAEVISLHATDTILYRKVGGAMLVSLGWIVSSLMTGLGELWDTRTVRFQLGRSAKPAGNPPSSFTNY
ncbi:MAG: hypothetical protein ABR905_01825 [Terracidiphilus sp.]|jgi:hypothetical protein